MRLCKYVRFEYIRIFFLKKAVLMFKIVLMIIRYVYMESLIELCIFR